MVITFPNSASMPVLTVTTSLPLSIVLVMPLVMPMISLQVDEGKVSISVMLPYVSTSLLRGPEMILPPVIYRIKESFLM